MTDSIQALIAGGLGINCEREMAHACTIAGASAHIIPINALLEGSVQLDNYGLVCFPGGFAFADELGAGKVLANRLIHAESRLKDALASFVEKGNAILGICNGFQLLVKVGLLPGKPASQSMSLGANDSSTFEDRWVHHKVQRSNSIFTRDLTHLYLPVRHGEGKLLGSCDESMVALKYANDLGEPTQRYPENPNGSPNANAALTDESGRILGMMAHPEAALYFTQDPRWTQEKERRQRKGDALPRYGDGFALFHNAISYLKENR